MTGLGDFWLRAVASLLLDLLVPVKQTVADGIVDLLKSPLCARLQPCSREPNKETQCRQTKNRPPTRKRIAARSRHFQLC
jgi:hypothetical protein